MGMSPKEVAAVLRRIASAIDNSKRPSLDMVRHDISVVVHRLAEEQQQEQQQQDQQGQQQQMHGQQQQQALPQSMSGKSMLKKLLSDCEEALDAGNDSKFKECLGKLQKSAV